jgi:hypothetical protein
MSNQQSAINIQQSPILRGAGLVTDINSLDRLISENNELISIFVASIKTASTKLKS